MEGKPVLQATVPRNDIRGDRMVGYGGEDAGERGRERGDDNHK